ncbi:MAG: F0F1 ATP synthase subunit gamma [Candidatus Brocadiaceae bacterium]|nr:F0F1 ATP synthase subunit gamma [Candidatus Brocadiaceae bacterium]
MQTLESLRKKIQSAEDLYTIVRTMKTLAAINIHHYEKAVESVTDYYRTVEMGLQVILRKGPIEMFSSPSDLGEKRTGVIIFGSDHGLCGGFNNQIVSYALEDMHEHSSAPDRHVILCVGSRISALLEEKGHSTGNIFSLPDSLAGLTDIGYEIVMAINDWQVEEKISKVILYYHKLISNISSQPRKTRLLPLNPEWFRSISSKKWPSHVIPGFTMDRNKLFSSLIRQYVFVSLYRAIAESMASENASRFLSMQAAEKNIKDQREEIDALYRHQYQSMITSELLDIVAGFEALQVSTDMIKKQSKKDEETS